MRDDVALRMRTRSLTLSVPLLDNTSFRASTLADGDSGAQPGALRSPRRERLAAPAEQTHRVAHWCLICRSCQSPTSWRAEGARLSPTVSVCERCSATASAKGSGGIGCDVGGQEEHKEEEEEGEGGGREESDQEEEDEDEDEEEEDGNSDDVDEDDEEGDNQVVSWSLTSLPVASSSSSEEE
ncbi:hypothetical protein Cni_G12311 [Canna indica]|uniref:Uncharacterized protein n=1 Tax=Canna indica TaxID=4628 RepID=A0AAQ3Q8W9_9LILI|nr:hypothetical protein Cni_G12311 [Canna indica]